MARIVFFGNERLATGVTTTAPTLSKLLEAGHEVCAVVSHHSDSRSRKQRGLEIADVAAQYDIPVLLPAKPAEIIDQLAAYKADIGVLVAYGKIVPQSVINIFPCGIVNIHPSLLPQHRGPIPLESVILDGSAQTGVSVMKLVRAMDAGPVYGQVSYDIPADTSKQRLADELLDAGGDLLIKLLHSILDGSLEPVPQDDAQATYDQLITKADGQLDFNKPAAVLAREVRAYSGWPSSYTRIGDKDIVIISAHQIESDGSVTLGSQWHQAKQFGFQATNGILVIDELRPASKQTMSAAAFLAGYSA